MTKITMNSAGTDPSASTPDQATAVVIVRKKKKKKYTRGLKRAQRAERRVSKSANRLADAVASGIATYRKRRDKSAEKRRDGAIVEFVPNVARGVSRAMRKSSVVPYELARAFNTKRTRRRLRRLVRLVAWR